MERKLKLAEAKASSEHLEQPNTRSCKPSQVGRLQGSVAALPLSRQLRAFEMLSVQPVTLIGLKQAERDSVIVSAVADSEGNEYALSRFGDSTWDLRSEMKAKNGKSKGLITWPADLPQAILNDIKAALYCVLRRGRDNSRPWTVSAVASAAQEGMAAARHFASIGIVDFSQLRPLHLSDYIADLRKRIKPKSVSHRLTFVDLVWHFRSEMVHSLQGHPWAGLALFDVCGGNEDDGGPSGRTGKTPVIPLSVQRALFAYCEKKLEESEDLFRLRDAGEITSYSYALTAVRDSVLYLLQITSGMRNSESTGITKNCWRTEVRNGVTFHWVRTIEVKGNRGNVEYLVPPETLDALKTLQRYSHPLQERLREEALWLEKMVKGGPDPNGKLSNGMMVAQAVRRLNHVREIENHLFLGINSKNSDHLGTGSRVDVMSISASLSQLKVLTKMAGVNWNLANHQCRRTFAFNVANSRLGRMGLIFLKWQLKHASISWTQLYASNPYQDHALYREMEEEMVDGRMSLMEGWMRPGAPLSGGAGKQLMQTRSIPVQNVGNLLRHTAESLTIQSTGHAWCLSGTQGCGGQGVYNPPMCGDCSQAVIDSEQSTAWQMIHLDNLRLAAISDCGPAVAQKAERAIKRSAQVLEELGISQPTLEQQDDYKLLAGELQ